jgi:hypothetical protein
MNHPECARCFCVIGEYLPCRDHGVINVWGADAYRWKPKPIDPCPPEAENDLQHPWWDFLDNVEMPARNKSGVNLGAIVP